MTIGSRRTRVVSPGEFDETFSELVRLAREAGASLAATADAVSTDSGRTYQGAKGLLEESLRDSLEDEVIPAAHIDRGGIDQSELGREVTKKALVGLKLATLRKLARENGLLVGGSLEDVASRVAKAYKWDQEEIARLVLANEDEPSIERGHISRLFPLDAPYIAEEAGESVKAMSGKYIRIGVARWFLFDSVKLNSDLLEILGTYKSYSASIDGFQQVASLHAEPHDASVSLHLDSSDILHVSGAGLPPSRGAVRAFEFISGVGAKGYIPMADSRSSGIPGGLHPTSALILDVIHNRLDHSVLSDINLTVARFKLREDERQPKQEEDIADQRPELKAVRFEGSHLLDSVVACRLLAVDGRPLVEIAFQTALRGDDGAVQGRFPVRVTVEHDHVAVQTGLGSGQHELSAFVHGAVLKSVGDAISDGILSDDRLGVLFERMKLRASEKSSPEAPDIFSGSPDGR